MKYFISIIFFISILSISSGLSAETPEQTFHLDPLTDISLISAGAALEFGGFFIHMPAPDLAEPAWYDNFSEIPYNKTMDDVSTYMAYAMLLAPALLAFDADLQDELLPLGVMYCEAFLLADGSKSFLKSLLPKYRPYVYLQGMDPSDSEYLQSFPSGHTTLVFMSASFLTTVSMLTPEMKNNTYWIAGLSFSGAALIAGMRIASGAHFLSDVLCGAALGSGIGFLVPFLHQNENFKISINSNGQTQIALIF